MNNTTEFLLSIFDKQYTPESITLEYSDESDIGTTLIFSLDQPDYEQLKFDLPVLMLGINGIKPAGLDLGLGLIESFDLKKDKRVYGFMVKGF